MISFAIKRTHNRSFKWPTIAKVHSNQHQKKNRDANLTSPPPSTSSRLPRSGGDRRVREGGTTKLPPSASRSRTGKQSMMTMEHVYDDPEFCGFLFSQTIEILCSVISTLCPEVEIFWDEHLDMPLKLCLWVSFCSPAIHFTGCKTED